MCGRRSGAAFGWRPIRGAVVLVEFVFADESGDLEAVDREIRRSLRL
jgi:hypothetical protein